MRNIAANLLRTDGGLEDRDNPGRIITTPEKAKECRRLVERLVTLAKKGGVANFRRAVALLGDKEMARKLFKEIAPRYAERQGGYTRILHLGDVRLGDAAPQCIFELVEEEIKTDRKPKAKRSPRRRRVPQAAGEPPVAAGEPEGAEEPTGAADGEGEEGR